MPFARTARRFRVPAVAAILILLFWAQLISSVSRESLTWDEGNHIFSGYMSLTSRDFGLNPEHPPLAKAFDALPLLAMKLDVPAVQDRQFKAEAYNQGRDFIFNNKAQPNPEAIIFPARLAASCFSVLGAILVFSAVRQMFGSAAGLIALALLAFEPTVIAHGALVTTDLPVSCFLLVSVFTFYRYCESPCWRRLLIAGLAAGLCLATKHSGILLFPMLLVLASVEAWQSKKFKPMLLGIAVIIVLSAAVLWAVYGFRFAARPPGLALNPPFAEAIKRTKELELPVFQFAEAHHLLPESYLYGLAEVRTGSDRPTFLLGEVYAHGIWFYFPAVFLIKSTVPFLLLLLIAAYVSRRRPRRAYQFVLIPAAVYFAAAVAAGLDIGARHILPVWIFAIVFCAGALSEWMRGTQGRSYAVAALLLFHAAAGLKAWPTNYIPYANELWGGPAAINHLLSDSNADWAQQLKSVARYVETRKLKKYWFAYYASPAIDARNYGIPCQPLPTSMTRLVGTIVDAPAVTEGTILISASIFNGFLFGSPVLEPYRVFQTVQPTAVIDNGVLVFDGSFPTPLLAAWPHLQRSQIALAQGMLPEALSEAQTAVGLAPDSIESLVQLGDTLVAMSRIPEAQRAYLHALRQIQSMRPDARIDWERTVREKLPGQ